MAGFHAQELSQQDPALASSSQFASGERVDARFGAGDAFYPGTIQFVHPETQTCDILYDDGDAESGVPFALVKKQEAAPAKAPTTENSTFAVGTVVQVRDFKGGWKDGTISVVREEGSFDVALSTGETEKGVPPSLVRLKEAGAAAEPAADVATAKSDAAGDQAEFGVPAAATEALKLTATTKRERALHEELFVVVKALERQVKSLNKNEKTIASLKTKIAAFQQQLSGSA